MTVLERTMSPSHRRIPALLTTSALTLGFAALPVGFGPDFAPHLSAAVAGNGHGDGNGNGHGNGNANGHASDNAGSNAADGNANSHTSDNADSSTAGDTGPLNATHAVTDAQAAVNVAMQAVANAQATLDAASTTGDQTQID